MKKAKKAEKAKKKVLRKAQKMGKRRHIGRMNIILVLHGQDFKPLTSVVQGLVRRNVRALKTSEVGSLAGALSSGKLRVTSDPVWRDAVAAIQDGQISIGGVAAWQAAESVVRGIPASVGFDRGMPVVVTSSSVELPVGVSQKDWRRYGTSPSVQSIADANRIQENMVITMDSNALPVRELNTAIAQHNADLISSGKAPPLYGPDGSGVRYRSEGKPERWWDAVEIARRGHDDCEGLAAYRAGELISMGYKADVYTRLVERSNAFGGRGGRGRLFHAITRVQLPGGRIAYDDPSARLGMPVPEWYIKQSRAKRAKGLKP